MVKKQIGYGTKLYLSTNTTSSTGDWTQIGGLLSCPGPDGTGTDVDTSTIDNATEFKTYQRSDVDPGTMNVTVAYGSTDSASKVLGTAYGNGDIYNWKVEFPSTTTPDETFLGYINSMGRALEKDSMITRTFGIKVSGDPGFPST
jgi:hypothetical protein